MNARLAIAAIVIVGSPFAGAQNVAEEIQPDAVLDALQEFKKRDKEKSNEVSVVLDPVGVPPAPVEGDPKSSPEAPKEAPAQEKPPTPAEPSPGPAVLVKPAEVDSGASDGLAVRVEKLQTGTGSIDPSTVKLLAPFPAKPLAKPPTGWRFDKSESAPPFTREVEISSGAKITLTIHPHVLIPEADGASVFAIAEPGYDSSLGYQQLSTVGAILSNSLHQWDNDSKQLGTAIDSLEQLLISLPKPEPQPEIKPAASPAPNRKR